VDKWTKLRVYCKLNATPFFLTKVTEFIESARRKKITISGLVWILSDLRNWFLGLTGLQSPNRSVFVFPVSKI
jgi:hypothetical protein